MIINKKIIAITFVLLMVMGAGLVIFSGHGGNHKAATAKPSSVTTNTKNSLNKTVGATNSGLTVPKSRLGNLATGGNSLTYLSFGSDSNIANNGSTWYINGNTLIVNKTVTIKNLSIGYSIQVASGAVLTLGSGVILNEIVNGNAYNNYTYNQLIISGAVIKGFLSSNVPIHTYEQPIKADYVNGSYFYAGVDIKIYHATFDQFNNHIRITNYGNITNSLFNYTFDAVNNESTLSAGTSNAVVYNSYFENINGYLNNVTNTMSVKQSNLSFNKTYVYSNMFNGKSSNQLTEENVNLSYDKMLPYGSTSYIALPNFAYSQYYNDYFNFTIPSSLWGNTTDVNNYVNNIGDGSGAGSYRGSINLNDSLYPVYMKHNQFAGGNGFELYGSGNAHIENNVFTEQYFFTAFFTLFQQKYLASPVENIMISNNTFYFYGNSILENNIDSVIGQGGGNTYITSGENGNLLSNTTLAFNTFQGLLFTVNLNIHQHASFVLGAYQNMYGNYFNSTGQFNGGSSITAPELEVDWFQSSGVSNMSLNYFSGLTSKTVAIAAVEVTNTAGSAMTGGTINLFQNTYKGKVSSAYQITAYVSYTINAINSKGYQNLTKNGTVTMVTGGALNGYTANLYALCDSVHVNLIINGVYNNLKLYTNLNYTSYNNTTISGTGSYTINASQASSNTTSILPFTIYIGNKQGYSLTNQTIIINHYGNYSYVININHKQPSFGQYLIEYMPFIIIIVILTGILMLGAVIRRN